MRLSENSLRTVTFHSRYAPLREAQRHVNTMMSGKNPAIIFIIGGGLNYISATLSESHPKIEQVSLQPCDYFLGKEVNTPRINWHPSSTMSLQETLRKALAGSRIAGGVVVLEWPPVVNHFQQNSEYIRSTLRDILEESSSNAATIGFWANRWLFNSIRFLSSVSKLGRLVPGENLLVLACAGPSLADCIPEIKARRSQIALWSLASAVPALLHYGLVPDLAIATDPGYWNGSHLRNAYFENIPIAMPPSSYASCGILHQSLIIPINTGLSFEVAAINSAKTFSEVAQASGSAAGTALSLALRTTCGPIVLAGYDLAAKGLLDHVKPYAFDIMDEKSASRLSSAYSTRASRVFENYPLSTGEWRRSRAFTTYADTIDASAQDRVRIFRLGASPIRTNFNRSDLMNIPDFPGSTPTCIIFKTWGGAGTTSRDEAVKVMLDSLSERAFDLSIAAIKNSEPLPIDAVLYYKALAPRESARLIADAARGEACLDDVSYIAVVAHAFASKRLHVTI